MKTEKYLVTKEKIQHYFNWSESTLNRRIREGVIKEYRLGGSRPYYDLREIENSFQAVENKNP